MASWLSASFVDLPTTSHWGWRDVLTAIYSVVGSEEVTGSLLGQLRAVM